jgi:hypothetical protein
MAELWALLHFIMPTLFDSHDEFNEWFSKDIESHAENKTGIDESEYFCVKRLLSNDIRLCMLIKKYIYYEFYIRAFIEASYDLETLHVAKNKERCRK